MPRGNATWMWVQACDLIGEAEHLHRRFFQLSADQHAQASWEPPVDVFENDDELLIVVAMPGVASDRLQVTHEAGALVVRGARPLPIGSGHRVRHLEIPYGAFERRIPLPPQRFEIGTPELSQGCLLLRLRKLGGAA